MRIVFLTGFLEPGRCGVGDYTRRIAAALVKQGHETKIIGLNDKFVDKEEEGFQEADEIKIPVLRLPSIAPAVERFSRAKEWMDDCAPDWVSLQLVLFSFNEKGLPFGLSNALCELVKDRRCHVMFHELWLGMEKEASLKIAVWGAVQKVLLKTITRKIKPLVIHTQTMLHQQALHEIGIKAEVLPLISNIPVNGKRVNDVFPNTTAAVSFVIFGSIYYGAPIAAFAREAGLFARKHGVQVTIISIGYNRKVSESWVTACKAEGLIVELLGAQTPERISYVLNNASFGISTTPLAIMEKSGTVVAMLEHGLPVLCIAREYNPKQKIRIKSVPGVVEYKEGNLEKSLTLLQSNSTPFSNSVTTIAQKFADSLLLKKKQQELFPV